MHIVDGSRQKRRNSIADTPELCLFHIKLSICGDDWLLEAFVGHASHRAFVFMGNYYHQHQRHCYRNFIIHNDSIVVVIIIIITTIVFIITRIIMVWYSSCYLKPYGYYNHK